MVECVKISDSNDVELRVNLSIGTECERLLSFAPINAFIAFDMFVCVFV